MKLFAALARRARAFLETDHDLEIFRKRAARALAAFPEGYARGARAYRDPVGRTRLVLLLDPVRFPSTQSLQFVIGLMSTQGGSYHVDYVDAPEHSIDEFNADKIEVVPTRPGIQTLAIVADVAWF